MNKIRLAEWIQLFESRMPGVKFSTDTFEPKKCAFLKSELKTIRSGGELSDYTDEELFTINIVAMWRKPK